MCCGDKQFEKKKVENKSCVAEGLAIASGTSHAPSLPENDVVRRHDPASGE